MSRLIENPIHIHYYYQGDFLCFRLYTILIIVKDDFVFKKKLFYWILYHYFQKEPSFKKKKMFNFDTNPRIIVEK